jgi:hypothetical protein
MGYVTPTTNNINYALVRKDLLTSASEDTLMKEVADFLKENYLKEQCELKIENRYGRKTIIFRDPKNLSTFVTIIYDDKNSYFNTAQKIKLVLALNSALLTFFNKMKTKFEEQGILNEKLNSYLLMMMIITTCQMEFESTKVKKKNLIF